MRMVLKYDLKCEIRGMNWTNAIQGFKDYLKFERGLSDNTLAAYSRDLSLLDQSSGKGPTSISAQDIQQFFSLDAGGADAHRRSFPPL